MHRPPNDARQWPERPKDQRQWPAQAVALLSLGGALAGVWWLYPQAYAWLWHLLATLFGPEDAPRRVLVTQFGSWGPAVLILGMLVQAAVPLLPAAADVVLAGLLYGFWGGFCIVYIGTLLGAALGYWLGKRWGTPLIERLAGAALSAKVHDFALQRGVWAVLLIRLMPALKAEVMNLVAGATGIPFWPFMGASALGALPTTMLVIWLSGTPQRLLWGTLGLSAVVALVAGAQYLISRKGTNTKAG